MKTTSSETTKNEQMPLERNVLTPEPKEDFELNILWGLLKYKGKYCIQAIIILLIVAVMIIVILAFFPGAYIFPKWLR